MVYLDDVLIYTGGTEAEHETTVRKILQRLIDYKLKVLPDKCEFHQPEVKFLEFIIGVNGLRLDPDKIKAILE